MSTRVGMRASLRVALVSALLSVGAVTQVAGAQDGPSLVVLVRHAEKAAEPADDPSLTDAGRQRAAALAMAVANAAPSAVIVSARKRTTETGLPTAAKFGLTPTVVSLDGGTATHIAAVVSAVRAQRGVVLVIGHSNTIPAVIKALGGPALPDICDATYNLMYTMVPPRDGRAVQVVVSQYGETSDAVVGGTKPCAGMKSDMK